MYKILGFAFVSAVIGLGFFLFASSSSSSNENNNEISKIDTDTVQIDKIETVEDYIIEIPEHDSIESWITDTKELLNKESFEPYSDRETYDFQVTQVTSAYARYFAIETEDQQTLEKLNEIEKTALNAALESNEKKRSEWIEELKRLLDQF